MRRGGRREELGDRTAKNGKGVKGKGREGKERVLRTRCKIA